MLDNPLTPGCNGELFSSQVAEKRRLIEFCGGGCKEYLSKFYRTQRLVRFTKALQHAAVDHPNSYADSAQPADKRFLQLAIRGRLFTKAALT